MDLGTTIASIVSVILFLVLPVVWFIGAIMSGLTDDNTQDNLSQAAKRAQEIKTGKSVGQGIVGQAKSLYKQGEKDLNKGR